VKILANRLIRTKYWHYGISLLLCLALVPVLRSQHLPLRFDWITLGIAYWFILSAQSIFVAVLLCLIGMPHRRVLAPFLTRCRQNRLRVLALLVYFVILVWATNWVKALVLGVDTIAFLELLDRRRGQPLRPTIAAILTPAAYLFFGFLMVLAYNCAIVSVRYNFATDPTLATIDRWLLHRHSVSELAHWAVNTFPPPLYRSLEFIYFGMFPQIGATLIILALSDGRNRALRFIGTILTSYYMALVIFYFWPAQGPYSLCPDHFSRFPTNIQSYTIQHTLIPHALALFHHQPISRISTDYFIAFPCMHIVQPVIVLWFLRRWRRMALVLAAYDVLLVAAVLMLEMHYVIDVLVGLLMAVLAIAISGRGSDEEKVLPATAFLQIGK
jgi:hypothetical protein